MDNAALDTADVPLLFAVKYLIREYRNCIATLQPMLDENRDLFAPLPNDHPVALGIPLPHSLLAPHRHFCDAVRAAIATIESLVEGMEAWADDIERTVRDAVRQTRRMLQNRSHPYCLKVVAEQFSSSLHMMVGRGRMATIHPRWQPSRLIDGAQFCDHTMRCGDGESTSGFEAG